MAPTVLLYLLVAGRWSRSERWSADHTLAVAAGGVLTYAWLGAVMEPETGPRTIAGHIGTGVLIVVVAGLVLLARHRLTAFGRTGRTSDRVRSRDDVDEDASPSRIPG